jgi:hypothetical protein
MTTETANKWLDWARHDARPGSRGHRAGAVGEKQRRGKGRPGRSAVLLPGDRGRIAEVGSGLPVQHQVAARPAGVREQEPPLGSFGYGHVAACHFALQPSPELMAMVPRPGGNPVWGGQMPGVWYASSGTQRARGAELTPPAASAAPSRELINACWS